MPGIPYYTAYALDRALEYGAEAIYLVLRLTKDRKLIAFPENDLSVMTDIKGLISEHDFHEISGADCAYRFDPEGNSSFPFRGKGMRLMELKEILARYPSLRFIFELMDERMADEFCSEISRMEAASRVMAASPGGSIIKSIKKRMPEMATVFPPMAVIGLYALFRSGLLFFFRRFRHNAIFIPEAIGPSYIANRGFIHELIGKGVSVFVWNIRDEEDVRQLTGFGVDGFITDDCHALKNILERIR
jgi:glycerophosphoryl diester phosphodiesterase